MTIDSTLALLRQGHLFTATARRHRRSADDWATRERYAVSLRLLGRPATRGLPGPDWTTGAARRSRHEPSPAGVGPTRDLRPRAFPRHRRRVERPLRAPGRRAARDRAPLPRRARHGPAARADREPLVGARRRSCARSGCRLVLATDSHAAAVRRRRPVLSPPGRAWGAGPGVEPWTPPSLSPKSRVPVRRRSRRSVILAGVKGRRRGRSASGRGADRSLLQHPGAPAAVIRRNG